jgi:predicted Zn-dependent protease
MNPARFFGQSAEFGTIEVGKRADLVLLTDSPLNEISHTQRIAGVMVRGRWLDEKELITRLHEVPSEYLREQQKVEAMLRDDPAQAVRYLEDSDPLGRLAAFAISEVASKEEVADLVQMLQAVRKANPNAGLVSEDSINALGYTLMNNKLYPQAIAVLAMNTESFPKSANTWDSLADAFFHSGDVANARKNYQKALDADAAYSNADFARKFIAEHAQK